MSNATPLTPDRRGLPGKTPAQRKRWEKKARRFIKLTRENKLALERETGEWHWIGATNG